MTSDARENNVRWSGLRSVPFKMALDECAAGRDQHRLVRAEQQQRREVHAVGDRHRGTARRQRQVDFQRGGHRRQNQQRHEGGRLTRIAARRADAPPSARSRWRRRRQCTAVRGVATSSHCRIVLGGQSVDTQPERVAAVGPGRRRVARFVGALGVARPPGPEGALGAADVRACPGLSFCSLASPGASPWRWRSSGR